MNPDTRSTIERHWGSSNARDWHTFAGLLAADLLYDVPQTRERIRSAAGYLDMFRTWPGDWRATVRQLICEPFAAVSVIDFAVGDEVMTGISFFRLSAEGLITHVTDYWPEPYEPPPRVSRHIERY